jgi:ribonuclease BN (tRNA processing enzyme)
LYGVDVESYVAFFRNADLLIFDAMFDLYESIARSSWGHSTALIGADLATRAQARRLVLFHHDHMAGDAAIWSFGDLARQAAATDPRRPNLQVQVAYEGMEIVI